MGKPILPLLRAGSSFMLVPVGPGVYSERVDESRDLSPQRLGGDSCCPELPKAAGIFIMFSCLCCVAPGCCRAQHSRHSLYQMYWPLVQPAQPLAPSCPSIPQDSGVLPLSGRSVLGFTPTTEGVVRAKPQNSAVAPSGTAGLQQFWLKKRWKIK